MDVSTIERLDGWYEIRLDSLVIVPALSHRSDLENCAGLQYAGDGGRFEEDSASSKGLCRVVNVGGGRRQGATVAFRAVIGISATSSSWQETIALEYQAR